MLPRLLLLLIAGIILAGYGTSQRLPRVKRQNLKVHINATGDTIVLKFIRPRPDMKLEGFILGYGSSMFSKQYIQLPENGKPYETEVDAEPKYLIAVQPIPANDVKKQCTGQVNLQKPLHLIIGSVTPSSVLLSWGTLLKTPFEGNIMNDCLEDGHYTVRYREKERNKKWNYENCPVSDTVIDRLKPNTEYEFGVRASKGKEDGLWSKPIVHQTNAGSPDKIKGQIENPENKIIMDQLRKPEVPDITGLNNRKTIPRTRNSPRLVYNRTIDREPLQPKSPGPAPKISFAPSEKHQDTSQPQTSSVPEWPQVTLANGEGRILPKSSNATQRAKIHWGKAYPFKNMTSSSAAGVPHTSPRALPTRNMPSSVKPAALPSANGETHQGQAQPRPTNTSQRTKSLWAHGEHHKGISQSKSHHFPQWPRIQLANGTQWEDNERQVHDYSEWPETKLASPLQRSPPDPSRRKQNTVVGKPGNIVKITEERQLPDKSSVLRTVLSSVTEKPAKQERKLMTAVDTRINATRMEPADNSSVFNPAPLLEVDSMGKERFIAPHVKYMMKEPDDPCSITESLRHFPEEEPSNQDITGPPKHPPSNLTVVTVEGCSSFVILDWQKVDNDSATEYEVISKSTGPSGNEESITVTNQTHTAVENLKADSSYEFTVLPKNVLGVGPSSEPVPFNTESADPRVSEYISGKDAIWTEYPFRSDSYSECNGKQFVKRTWYRKFVGVQLCNSLRYKIYLSDTLTGTFYNIGDQTGHGEDHCQFVDSFLDGRTGQQFPNDQLPQREGYYRAIRQEPVNFGEIGGKAQINYVQWYECGTTIPGKW
ncbi:ABI family, member 3 (NESH) binding protein b isoform X14 [Polyodon spathula]|uniref:ABI family, member 3 (NESH) binding protein b isoform X14 n=1 Tax=Polyodon spathula TaxID=7913 RepID=UPI001B7F2D52|nr:ABI family, member 3 (NESH) binding protein b isoform X14 [Polyodon spathula]